MSFFLMCHEGEQKGFLYSEAVKAWFCQFIQNMMLRLSVVNPGPLYID